MKHRAGLLLGLFFDMKMETVSSSEMLVNFYQTTRSYTAEDRALQHSRNWEHHADSTSSDKTANNNIKKQQKI
jgi:hypothetical protein